MRYLLNPTIYTQGLRDNIMILCAIEASLECYCKQKEHKTYKINIHV
jgi:hypothetical protein